MKITEVEQMSDNKLFESIDSDNDTGFLTEDLVSIVKTHRANEWSKPMTSEEFSAWMESVVNG